MTAITRLLPLVVGLLLLPAGAHAAPRVAHQDVVDDAWVTEDPATVADPVTTVTDDVVDTVVDDPGDGWDEETEGGEDWGTEDAVPSPVIEYVTGRTVAGRVAMLRRNGKAAIPRSAPRRVKLLIAAANRIVGKPYKWGGGHAKLEDRGYDCSGTVSYALIRSGLLASPLVSGSFAKWGRADAGRWITLYANKGHVYMEVAGLRLDTSAMGDPAGGSGPRWRPAIGKRRGFHVRHVAGL